MSFVSALGRKMQYVTGVRFIAIQPICDVLSKSTTNLRLESDHIIFAQGFQPRLSPFSHRNHHCILVHLEIWRLVELKTSFPSVAKSVRPFAWMTVLFVPDKFFRPQPSLFSHSENELDYICVPLASNDFFFDVQNERATWLQNPQKFARTLQEPIDVVARFDAAVCSRPTVRVRRRGDNQIKKRVRIFAKDLSAITQSDFTFCLRHAGQFMRRIIKRECALSKF